jgi:hypothetical protein
MSKITFFQTFEETLWQQPHMDFQLDYSSTHGKWTVTIMEGSAAVKAPLCTISRTTRAAALKAAASCLLAKYPPRYNVRTCTEEEAIAKGLRPLTEVLSLEQLRPVSAQMGNSLHYITEKLPAKPGFRKFQLWTAPRLPENKVLSIRKNLSPTRKG